MNLGTIILQVDPVNGAVTAAPAEATSNAAQASETSVATTTTTTEQPSTPPPAPKQEGSQWSFYIMMIALVVVFYFFMIRPQSQRRKEQQKKLDEFRGKLKVGDQVVIAGGVYGKVKELKDNYAMLDIANNITIKVDLDFVYASPADSQPAK